MNHHSFFHYMILSSANPGIYTVLMEEEIPGFSIIREGAGRVPVLPSHCFMGWGWVCHTLTLLSNGVKEVLLSHNKYSNIYALPHPDRGQEARIWSSHLISLISSQVLLLTLAGLRFSSLWGLCPAGNAENIPRAVQAGPGPGWDVNVDKSGAQYCKLDEFYPFATQIFLPIRTFCKVEMELPSLQAAWWQQIKSVWWNSAVAQKYCDLFAGKEFRFAWEKNQIPEDSLLQEQGWGILVAGSTEKLCLPLEPWKCPRFGQDFGSLQKIMRSFQMQNCHNSHQQTR